MRGIIYCLKLKSLLRSLSITAHPYIYNRRGLSGWYQSMHHPTPDQPGFMQDTTLMWNSFGWHSHGWGCPEGHEIPPCDRNKKPLLCSHCPAFHQYKLKILPFIHNCFTICVIDQFTPSSSCSDSRLLVALPLVHLSSTGWALRHRWMTHCPSYSFDHTKPISICSTTFPVISLFACCTRDLTKPIICCNHACWEHPITLNMHKLACYLP